MREGIVRSRKGDVFTAEVSGVSHDFKYAGGGLDKGIQKGAEVRIAYDPDNQPLQDGRYVISSLELLTPPISRSAPRLQNGEGR